MSEEIERVYTAEQRKQDEQEEREHAETARLLAKLETLTLLERETLAERMQDAMPREFVTEIVQHLKDDAMPLNQAMKWLGGVDERERCLQARAKRHRRE